MRQTFRCSGYYYEAETGFYCLSSRYYDPEVGRFINADDVSYLGADGSPLSYNMFAYCKNNPINMIDLNGNNPLALPWLWGASAATTAVFGWAIAGIVVVGFTIWAGASAYNYYQSKQAEAVARARALMNYASTAATPPPPNKGGKGTQATSENLYTKRGRNGFRIDVENPGNRVGQIHLQKDGVKYVYDVVNQVFRIKKTTGKLASRAIQELLQDPEVIKAIAKGLTILGY